MPLLRELIDIPERVRSGDFVLRLTEGVARPQETLRDYVVTPQLVTCFDDALAFIRSALDARSSKTAYLHGSFGAGKSHFMAVLLLLLNHDAERAVRGGARAHRREAQRVARGPAVPARAERVQSLEDAFRPRPPLGANLGAAFEHLLDQILAHQYPAHPRFETDVRLNPARARLIHRL
jgi:hypothetical protein